MRWWRRVWRGALRRESAGTISADANVLVISDIHLGEDILTHGPEHLAGNIRALNRELANFIGHHRQNRIDGRRWHLVVNGDLFDFVRVSPRPEADERAAEKRPASYGPGAEYLENTAEHVAWKVRRIVEVHRPVFREMAHFLLEGHSISIVEGNHDAEFYFEAVQQVLRDSVVGLAAKMHLAHRRTEAFDGEEVGSRLRFRCWFEALPGRYHIEHGHQYDEMCSFEYKLAPFDGVGAQTLATPLSHRPMLYIGELLGDFSTHGVERMTLAQVLRHVASLGPRTLWVLLKLYVVVAMEILWEGGARRQEKLSALAAEHEAHLRAMSQRSPYGYDTLVRIDKLKAQPAEYSTLKMIHAFFLDRFFVGGVVVLALLPALLMDDVVQMWWSGVVLGLGGAALLVVARLPKPAVGARLRGAAAAIADETGARYVVFGHSHQPELVDLREAFGIGRFGESAYYLNSGSWVTREVLRGGQGDGMTYVQIARDGAGLLRWNGVGVEPTVLGHTGAAVRAQLTAAASAGPGEARFRGAKKPGG